MSVDIIKNPSVYAFVNNPVKFTIRTTEESMIYIFLSIDKKVVFSGSYVPFNSVVEIDIADILLSYIKSNPVRLVDYLLIPVNDAIANYELTINGNTSVSFSGKALCGGISKKLLRKFEAYSLDMFSYRLNNASRQFFFTTRTNGRNILMRETELSPILFIAPSVSFSFVSERGNVIVVSELTVGNIYALNLDYLRKDLFNKYSEISAYVSVLIDGNYICDISFTPGALSLECYVLLFRNSLGCYEKIECVGKSEHSSTWNDESDFMSYDSNISGYVRGNKRKAVTDTIKVQSGFKNKDEFLFLKDLLSSDDIRLIFSDGYEQKVQVTADDFSLPGKITEPVSISLTLKDAEDDSNVSPDLDLKASYVQSGEWFLEYGTINSFGFIYNNRTLTY